MSSHGNALFFSNPVILSGGETTTRDDKSTMPSAARDDVYKSTQG